MMQTFLPYADFSGSAAALDPRRLGKQRVEAIQVLRGLTVPGYGWRHHPAVRMWAGYEEALVRYGLDVRRVDRRGQGGHLRDDPARGPRRVARAHHRPHGRGTRTGAGAAPVGG